MFVSPGKSFCLVTVRFTRPLRREPCCKGQTRLRFQINFKIWRLVLHVAAEECYCMWTDRGRVGVEQERHRVEREEGDFERHFPCDSPTENYYATTRTTPTTSYKPPCSTRPLHFTQAHALTTSLAVKVHQLHIYNNRQPAFPLSGVTAYLTHQILVKTHKKERQCVK